MKDFLLDANVLLRFLTQDDPKQGAAAVALFERSERREIILHLDGLVVSETVCVLMKLYGKSRIEVVNVLQSIIQNAGIETLDAEVVTDALHRFALFNVDFPDAWLAARSAQMGHAVASFDRDFDKF